LFLFLLALRGLKSYFLYTDLPVSVYLGSYVACHGTLQLNF